MFSVEKREKKVRILPKTTETTITVVRLPVSTLPEKDVFVLVEYNLCFHYLQDLT